MFRVVPCERLPSGGTIVKSDQYAAALKADQIIAQARADAEAIRNEAKEEYQSQKRQGYADGKEQANQATAARLMDNIAETAAYFSVVEDRLAQVVRKALRKMLGELDEHELIVRVVRQALAWARNQSRVTVRVCSTQAGRLQTRVEEIRRGYPAIAVLDVVADDNLQPLDCVLETEIGSVNASVDTQLAAIEAALSRALHGEYASESEDPASARSSSNPDSAEDRSTGNTQGRQAAQQPSPLE